MRSLIYEVMSNGVLENKQPQLLYRLSATHFVTDAYAGFMIPLLPILAITLGFSHAATGLLLTLASLGASILQPLYGYWTDRFKNIPFITIGIIIATLFLSMIGWSPNYWTLSMLVFFGYVGVGMFHPAATTLIHQLQNQGQNFIMGCFLSAGLIGYAFGMFFSSFLVDYGGLQATCFGAALGLLGWVLCRKIQKAPKRTVQLTERFNKPSSKAPSSTFDFNRSEILLLGLICLIGMVRSFTLAGLQSFMPFIWTEEGYGLMVIGTVVASASIIGGPTGLIGGYLSDRFGEKNVLFLTFSPCIFLFPLVLETSGLLSFIFLVALCGVMQANLGTLVVLGLREIPKKPNTVSGIVNGLAWGLGGLLMPLFGYLSDLIGIHQALYGMMLPLLVIGAGAILLLPGKTVTNTTVSIQAQEPLLEATPIAIAEPTPLREQSV